MKKLFVRTVIIVILFLVILISIYKKEIVNSIFKKDIYIVYTQNDLIKTIDWGQSSSLFPKNFNPKKVLVNIGELSKLSFKQKNQFDSIINAFYNYPRKIINKNEYSISISNGLAIKFENLESKLINFSKVSSLNIIDIDSLIQIMYDVKLLESTRLNIIEIDSKNKRAKVTYVKPFLIEYN